MRFREGAIAERVGEVVFVNREGFALARMHFSPVVDRSKTTRLERIDQVKRAV